MTKQVNDNILNWFRKEFVPNASDETIAALVFLYNKYGEELSTSESAKEFIEEETQRLKMTPVNRV